MIENTFPFVKDLSEEDRAMLMGSIVTKSFPKGSIVNRNEDGCVGVLSVTAGRLRVYIVSDEGREITLFRVDLGEICVLSVSCLLDSIAFDVVIEASEDTVVSIIPAAVVHRLEKDNPGVGLFLYKTAAEKFSEVIWTMQQIMFMKLDQRIAIFLWDEQSKKDGNVLMLTHDEIARQIGSSREVVTRIMKYFEQEGILSLERGKVVITDKNALKKTAYPDM
jgi:CRP/FNR family transcriptional regulator